jgi:preprotein translocase SecE subunit
MNTVLAILGIVFASLLVLTLVVNYKSVLAFAKGARNEMKRVTFPTWEKASAQTYVVLGSVVVFAIFFGLFDLILVQVMGMLF